jgi:alpha-L-fucosidase
MQWNEQIPMDEYARLADQFTLTNFSVAAWVDIAKSVGMKYLVRTP